MDTNRDLFRDVIDAFDAEGTDDTQHTEAPIDVDRTRRRVVVDAFDAAMIEMINRHPPVVSYTHRGWPKLW